MDAVMHLVFSVPGIMFASIVAGTCIIDHFYNPGSDYFNENGN